MKLINRHKKNQLTILFLVIFLFAFNYSQAAILSIDSDQGSYHEKDNFIVDIRIDTEDECINTVSVEIIFDSEILLVKDFSKASSIISLWLEEPEIINKEGKVVFSGGIPGGYCGILYGDPGESNLLGRIIFEVKENINEELNTEILVSENSKVFLNDGFATQTKISFKSLFLDIYPGVLEKEKEEWEKELGQDKIVPEPFNLEIIQDPFDGKYLAVFHTTDKQTGIDYYQIKEGRGDWKKVTSPYLLKDQNLKSEIKVKAVDGAGNERIVEHNPVQEKDNSIYLFLFFTTLLIIIAWIIKRRSLWKRNQSQF